MKTAIEKAKGSDLLQKLGAKNIPIVAFIELTNKCDFDCIHCMRSTKKISVLPKDIFNNLVSDLATLGVLNLTLTGGEPLMHKDFFELARYAKEKGFNINISSNGVKVDRTNIFLLKKLNPTVVQVSIYGTSSDSHDAITQVKGSYQKTLGALKLLKDIGINVKVHTTVMKQNFSEFEAIRNQARNEGWAFSYDFIIYPSDDGSFDVLSCRITDEQLAIARKRKLLNKESFIEKYPRGARIKNAHELATISCRISSSGDVFPSGTLRLPLGNLKKRSFSDIWFNSEVANKLRAMRLADFECSTCQDSLRCLWDIGLAFAEHGEITSRPYEWCRFVKRRRNGQ